MPTSNCTLRHIAGNVTLRLCLASVILWPLTGSAVTVQEISTTIRREVAANPGQGPAIVSRTLRALPEGERTRLATAALAAALKDKEEDCERVVALFRSAVAAAPDAVLGLMEVAHRAAPDCIVDITRVALESARRGEQIDPTLARRILAQAISLSPESRSALIALARGTLPSNLVAQILDALGGGVGPAVVRSATLGGTINPANLGGSVDADDDDADDQEVSPAAPGSAQ